jgi:hypothetical protein
VPGVDLYSVIQHQQPAPDAFYQLLVVAAGTGQVRAANAAIKQGIAAE